METLKIEIPKGFEVKDFNKETGEITFKETPKDIKERIKTLDDILKHHGIEPDDFESDYKGLPEHIINYQYLVLLAEALNEGWEPNWDNSNEYKYYPWFVMRSSGFRFGVCVNWSTSSFVGSRLCFKSRKLAEYAGNQFTDLYKKYMTK